MSIESDLRPFVATIMTRHRLVHPTLEDILNSILTPAALLTAREEVEAAERKILNRLAKLKHPFHFRAHGDLADWVMRQAAAAVMRGMESEDPNLAMEITAQLLKDPRAPFDFALRLQDNDRDQSYHATLTDDLALDSDAESVPELRGRVFAYSYAVALDESCRTIREVIGALLAVGLAVSGWSLPEMELDFKLTGGFGTENQGIPIPGELTDLVSRTYLEDYVGVQSDQARPDPAERVRRQLEKVWQNRSERALEIRTACGLYARAEVATDPGVAALNYSMCLESLLLDEAVKDNVTARLKEAVAYRLGKSASDRHRLRKLTDRLYDFRSRYAHTGRIQADFALQGEWASIVREALEREIEAL